jgi:hypothetical protein
LPISNPTDCWGFCVELSKSLINKRPFVYSLSAKSSIPTFFISLLYEHIRLN